MVRSLIEITIPIDDDICSGEASNFEDAHKKDKITDEELPLEIRIIYAVQSMRYFDNLALFYKWLVTDELFAIVIAVAFFACPSICGLLVSCPFFSPFYFKQIAHEKFEF